MELLKERVIFLFLYNNSYKIIVDSVFRILFGFSFRKKNYLWIYFGSSVGEGRVNG